MKLVALIAGLSLAIGAAACGRGSTETTSAGSTRATSATTAAMVPAAPSTRTSTTPAPAPSPSSGSRSSSESSSSAAAQSRRYPHGDNSIQTFGKAAGEADTQAVTSAVKRYYAAVAAGNGAAACALLSSGLSKSIVQGFGPSPALRGKGCAGILALLFKRRPGNAAASLAAIDVTRVRLKGDRGFALLRSKAMPSGEITVDREGGVWKIGSLIGSSLG